MLKKILAPQKNAPKDQKQSKKLQKVSKISKIKQISKIAKNASFFFRSRRAAEPRTLPPPRRGRGRGGFGGDINAETQLCLKSEV